MNDTANDKFQRFVSQPRPLSYSRIRLFTADSADWLLNVLRESRNDMLEELASLRRDGVSESGPEISSVVNDIRHCADITAELDRAIIELVGPGYTSPDR